MQLIEAALAFAITMLALSLVVSSFVEIIHRIFSMREAGLKYVIRQMFDQVLDRHIETGISAMPDDKKPEGALIETARKGFVERMSANRVPMGVTPKATFSDAASRDPASSPGNWISQGLALIKLGLSKIGLGEVRLWNGRDLAAMTPVEFMERLGSVDHIGPAIAKANDVAHDTAMKAGASAADAADLVLKDIAQKFDAFGKEASTYFEGRARLLSVVVAIALAFAAHVDAVDLFKTYLRDPNARTKVIEQSEAITAQYKAAEKAIETLSGIKGRPPVPAPAAADILPEQKAAAKREEDKKAADAKALDEQIEGLKKDALAAISNAQSNVKQFAELGVPLGWTPERIVRAKMTDPWVWTCKDPNKNEGEGLESLWKDCGKNKWKKEIWFQAPTEPAVVLYLFLGGLLVGLGAPFWYNAVTGLTNIRNSARGTVSTDLQVRTAIAAAGGGTTQPATPVDVFKVSVAARQ